MFVCCFNSTLCILVYANYRPQYIPWPYYLFISQYFHLNSYFIWISCGRSLRIIARKRKRLCLNCYSSYIFKIIMHGIYASLKHGSIDMIKGHDETLCKLLFLRRQLLSTVQLPNEYRLYCLAFLHIHRLFKIFDFIELSLFFLELFGFSKPWHHCFGDCLPACSNLGWPTSLVKRIVEMRFSTVFKGRWMAFSLRSWTSSKWAIYFYLMKKIKIRIS